VHYVGNTMIDTLLSRIDEARQLEAWREHGVEPGGYVLVTLHRPALVDDPDLLRRTLAALGEIARDIPVVFPVHPRTRDRIRTLRVEISQAIRLAEPQPYGPFLSLEADALAVITDSGGVQEETTALGVPCFTLRSNTERPVTTSHGSNTLLGLDPDRIADVPQLLREPRPPATPPLWDGQAGVRAAHVVETFLGVAAAERSSAGGLVAPVPSPVAIPARRPAS
jgi:UDP-N-acetylglucosamine 2-epimerase (non-hydrolysing)